MFFIKSVRNRALKRATKRRHPIFKKIDEVSSLLLIFNVEEEGVKRAIEELLLFSKAKGIKPTLLPLTEAKEHPGVTILEQKGRAITKRDLKYGGVPSKEVLAPYLKEKWELLIDFGATYNFTNLYLSYAIDATFKVGRVDHKELDASYSTDPFDLILESGESSPTAYVKNLLHYLSVIEPLK